MMINVFVFSVLVGCKGDPDGVTTEDHVPPRELTLPDISNIDIELAFSQAIQQTARLQLNPAWDGNRTILEMGRTNCPNLYIGGPEVGDTDLRDGDGQSWSDFCGNSTALNYSGFVYWEGNVSQSIDNSSEDGHVVDGSRTIVGQSSVKYGQELIYEFKGDASDSMHLVQSPSNNYRQWTYSSTVNGTIDGTEATGLDNGFRSDMYLYATGDEAASLEARGNAFWFDYRIQDRFDSVGMDIYLVDETTAGPDDCPEEPKGWIGIRDTQAYWYDLVFMPKDADDDMGYLDEDRSVCDGCGTLYLRGIETTENYGTICPDFSGIWNGDLINLPTENDYLLTIQQLQDGE